MMEPVAWRWAWKTTGSELEQRFADPDLYEWTYRDRPPSEDAALKVDVEPLVRLSDAEARIAELETENARHLAEIDRKSSMPGDYRYWEGRYRDAEALLKEAGKALEPFAMLFAEFPSSTWRKKDADQVWGYNGYDLTYGHLRSARAISDKIGVKDE